jgi:Rrf2 family protein
MPSALKTSEAAALAMHAVAMLSGAQDGPLSCRKIAASLKASPHHMAKVLQRLGKAGLVEAARGPRGGFTLARPADEIALLQVYEAIDGPLALSACLLQSPQCEGNCILGDLLASLNRSVEQALKGTKVSDLTGFATRRSPINLEEKEQQ